MNVATPTRADNATVPPAAPQAAREAELWPALRAVIFKEVRPALPWALVILAFIGFLTVLPALLDVLYPERDPSRGMDAINILANADFQMLLVPLAAVVGLGLGIAQAVASRGRDQWAFLVHRPIRREYLFLGRVLAGLVLYGITAGFPAAILMIYAALSSRPPYDWHMNLPVLADLAGGAVYLFAGMLLVERKAFIMWRPLPLAGLLVLSGSIVFLPGFGESLLAVAGFAAVLGLAALGSHVSDGNQLSAPRITRAATIATLFFGGTVLLGTLSLGLRSAVLSVAEQWNEQTEQEPQANVLYRGTVTRYLLLPSGEVGKMTLTLPPAADPNSDAPPKRWAYHAVDSGELVEGPTEENRNYFNEHETWLRLSTLRSGYRDLAGVSQPGGVDTHREGAIVTQIVHEKWYVIPTAGVLKGYDAATNAYLGSMGVDGFAPPGRSPQPFNYLGPGYAVCVGPQGVYTVNLTAHTTQLVNEFPPDFHLRGAGIVDNDWHTGPIHGPSSYTVLRGDDRLLLYGNPQTTQKPLVTLMLTDPKALNVQVNLFRGPEADGSGGRWAVTYRYGHFPNDDWPGVTYDTYDASGKQLEHQSFAAEAVYDPPLEEKPEVVRVEHMTRLTEGVLDGMGNLPALAGLSAVRHEMNVDSPQEFVEPYAAWYISGAAMSLLASGVAVIWATRRYRLRFGAFWALGALIFGPVVGVVLIATHILPRRGACPACGRKRPFVTARCPHCGKAWPATEANGTEIFG